MWSGRSVEVDGGFGFRHFGWRLKARRRMVRLQLVVAAFDVDSCTRSAAQTLCLPSGWRIQVRHEVVFNHAEPAEPALRMYSASDLPGFGITSSKSEKLTFWKLRFKGINNRADVRVGKVTLTLGSNDVTERSDSPRWSWRFDRCRWRCRSGR